MTILKVRIVLIEKAPGEFIYKYPENYDAKKISILVYSPVSLEDNFRVKYCVGIIEDSIKKSFLQKKDIVEISKEEANILCNAWTSLVLKITNEKLVTFIINKIKQGIPLIHEEIKALDPNENTVLGINYSKKININDYISFNEVI